MLARFSKFIGRFRREGQGSILVETAAAIPILVLLTMAGAEFARYMLLHQKTDRVAAMVGDLISQQETLTEQQVADLFSAVDQVFLPFQMGSDGVVFVSSVSIPTGESDPKVRWQKTTGSYSATSKVGTADAVATLPGTLQVQVGETAIISEMYFKYTPFFYDKFIGGHEMYKVSAYRPRLSKLEEVLP